MTLLRRSLLWATTTLCVSAGLVVAVVRFTDIGLLNPETVFTSADQGGREFLARHARRRENATARLLRVHSAALATPCDLSTTSGYPFPSRVNEFVRENLQDSGYWHQARAADVRVFLKSRHEQIEAIRNVLTQNPTADWGDDPYRSPMPNLPAHWELLNTLLASAVADTLESREEAARQGIVAASRLADSIAGRREHDCHVVAAREYMLIAAVARTVPNASVPVDQLRLREDLREMLRGDVWSTVRFVVEYANSRGSQLSDSEVESVMREYATRIGACIDRIRTWDPCAGSAVEVCALPQLASSKIPFRVAWPNVRQEANRNAAARLQLELSDLVKRPLPSREAELGASAVCPTARWTIRRNEKSDLEVGLSAPIPFSGEGDPELRYVLRDIGTKDAAASK